MTIIIKCLILFLSLFVTQSWATVAVQKFPSGTPVQVCQASDTNPSCGSSGGGGNVGIGTTNYIPVYTAASTLGPSNIVSVNSNVGINSVNPEYNLTVVGTMKVRNGGNTGIGTDFPGEALDVQGTVRTTGFTLSTSPTNGYVLTSDSAGKGSWQASSGSGNVGIGTTNTVTYWGPGNTLQSSNNFSFDGNNVGIGTASVSHRLEVYGSAIVLQFIAPTANGAAAMQIRGGQAGGQLLLMGQESSSSGGTLLLNTVNNDAVLNTSGPNLRLSSAGLGQLVVGSANSGSIGMGVNTPINRLDVNSGVAFGLNYAGVYTAPTNGLIIQGNLGIGTFSPDSGKLIVTGGNVGIGSVVPGQTLDVNGTVRALNFSGAGSGLTGTAASLNIGGNSGTATALAANGTNCSAGNYPLGVDASGNSESCTVASTGTVTSASVATANGFSGTVATATTTPAITIQTTVTGLLKGNGTSVSAASSGSDYAPATSGSNLLFGNGAGGFTNVSNSATDGNNVGIGTTKTTLAALSVYGGNVGIGTFSPSAPFQVNSSASAVAFIVNGSNVGIGTSLNPGGGQLFIGGGASSIGVISFPQASPSNGANGIGRASSSFNGVLANDFGIRGNNNLYFGATSTPRGISMNNANNVGIGTLSAFGGQLIVDTTSGNMGIGSLTPGAMLDIKGIGRFTGTGHLASVGTAPTVASNDCGSTVQGSVTAGSTDLKGSFTVGTLAVTSCAITLAGTFTVGPICITQDDTNVLGVKTSCTTTKCTTTSTTSMSGDLISYICVE